MKLCVNEKPYKVERPELVLVRGIPGAGKSTYARKLSNTHVHYESDMFMVNTHGAYDFDASKVAETHKRCFEGVSNALSLGYNVVVSNTFTQRWEMQKYIDLQYYTRIVVLDGGYDSVHNVPKDKVALMKRHFDHDIAIGDGLWAK